MKCRRRILSGILAASIALQGLTQLVEPLPKGGRPTVPGISANLSYPGEWHQFALATPVLASHSALISGESLGSLIRQLRLPLVWHLLPFYRQELRWASASVLLATFASNHLDSLVPVIGITSLWLASEVRWMSWRRQLGVVADRLLAFVEPSPEIVAHPSEYFPGKIPYYDHKEKFLQEYIAHLNVAGLGSRGAVRVATYFCQWPLLAGLTRRQAEELSSFYGTLVFGGAEPLASVADDAHAAMIENLGDPQQSTSSLWDVSNGRQMLLNALAGNQVGKMPFYRAALKGNRGLAAYANEIRQPFYSLSTDHSQELLDFLSLKRRKVVYLLDNLMEDVQDLFLIRWLGAQGHSVTVVAKAGDASNDTTVSRFESLLRKPPVQRLFGNAKGGYDFKVISSGAAIQGTDFRRATPEFISAWRHADVVISKGEGNRRSLMRTALTRDVYTLMVSKSKESSGGFSAGTALIEKIPAQPSASLNTKTPTLETSICEGAVDPAFDVSSPLAALAKAVKEKLPDGGRIILEGPPGVGKSTFAKLLRTELERMGRSSRVIPIDSFLIPLPMLRHYVSRVIEQNLSIKDVHRHILWADRVNEVFGAINRVVRHSNAGQPSAISFKDGFLAGRDLFSELRFDMDGVSDVIVEGAFALAFRSIHAYPSQSVVVWIDSTYENCLNRYLNREGSADEARLNRKKRFFDLALWPTILAYRSGVQCFVDFNLKLDEKEGDSPLRPVRHSKKEVIRRVIHRVAVWIDEWRDDLVDVVFKALGGSAIPRTLAASS